MAGAATSEVQSFMQPDTRTGGHGQRFHHLPTLKFILGSRDGQTGPPSALRIGVPVSHHDEFKILMTNIEKHPAAKTAYSAS
jgi:hypothetical protein